MNKTNYDAIKEMDQQELATFIYYLSIHVEVMYAALSPELDLHSKEAEAKLRLGIIGDFISSKYDDNGFPFLLPKNVVIFPHIEGVPYEARKDN